MRYVLALGLLLVLAACGPVDPSGGAVTAPSTLDGEAVVSVEQIGFARDVPQVRVRVSDDLVFRFVVIDGEPLELVGVPIEGGWLSDAGTLVTTLAPGEHTLRAYSCQESFWGFSCGCRSEGDCGYWMETSFAVRGVADERFLGQDEDYFR